MEWELLGSFRQGREVNGKCFVLVCFVVNTPVLPTIERVGEGQRCQQSGVGTTSRSPSGMSSSHTCIHVCSDTVHA